MNKQKLIAAVGIVLITTLILAGNSFGQEGVTHYGVKAGLVTPGEVTIEGLGSDDGDISYSFGGFLDYGLAAKLSGGLSLDLHNAKYGEFSKTLIDFSLTLKALVSRPEASTKIRPGIALGYGAMGATDNDEDGTKYFLVKAGVELLFDRGQGPDWLGELAVFGAPSGGNDAASVTFGPGLILRAGIQF